MSTPREIIADAIDGIADDYAEFPSSEVIAGIATEALTAGGYHILSDAELAARDNAVLEKAARRARECFDDEQAEADPAYVPSAIRALGRKA